MKEIVAEILEILEILEAFVFTVITILFPIGSIMIAVKLLVLLYKWLF